MEKSDPAPIEALYRESLALVASGDTRKALSTLFRLFVLDPAHEHALAAASKLMALLQDAKGSYFIQEVSKDPKNPRTLYDLGYHLINMGRPDVARPFLEACLLHGGEVPEVLYELGYCHYLDRQFGRAADTLKKASENLDPDRAAAADLLSIECLLYTGRVEEGITFLEETEDALRYQEQGEAVDALHLTYARFKRVEGDEPMDLRAWHFVQNGGVLLAQSRMEASRGHFSSLAMNAVAVGAVLRLLQSVVEGLELELDALLFVEGSHSYTLSLALGSILGRPVRSWNERAGSKELLVLPDPDTATKAGIQPVDRETCAYLFCFRVFPLQEVAFLPEFIGLMAYQFLFPWQERVEIIPDTGEGASAREQPADTREAEVIAAEIADAARMLPEDDNAAKVASFYRRHRNHLVLGNLDRFPRRRIFHPLTPAK